MKTPHPARRRAGFALFDLVVVASFVIIGRDTHNESQGIGEVVQTAAPFLLALAGAWITPLVHRTPWRLGSGLAVGVTTTAAGLFFRSVVFGEGISGAFPIVAAAYLIGLMAAGRVAGALRRRHATG